MPGAGRLRRTAGLLAAMALTSGAAPSAEPEFDAEYLRRVRAYADALLTHGRDTYGETTSPLIATTLDRETFARPAETPPEIEGVPADRRVPGGANPMHDQNLYQILYALTSVTGEGRYAQEADETLSWFLIHAQNRQSGLLPWGRYMGWDFEREAPIRKPMGILHAFFRPWALWDRCYDLAPLSCLRFAKGLWTHHVGDPATGDFSYRAPYDRRAPSVKNDYPNHGGYFLATWSKAVARIREDPRLVRDLRTWPIAIEEERDRLFSKAIAKLTAFFEGKRSPETDAIPRDTGSPIKPDPWRGRIVRPHWNVSLAIDLWNGAEAVAGPLAGAMRLSASRTDSVFLRMDHDPAGAGFLTGADLYTLKPFGAEKGRRSTMWQAGEGRWTTAGVGVVCALRYGQVPREGYRDLVVAAAEAYMKSAPEVSNVGRPGALERAWSAVTGSGEPPLYPLAAGQAIELMVRAHAMTGDGRYLLRAERFASFGIRVFLGGESPLPRATHLHDHYEAVTGADTFMMALLKLWAVRNGRAEEVRLAWTDR